MGAQTASDAIMLARRAGYAGVFVRATSLARNTWVNRARNARAHFRGAPVELPTRTLDGEREQLSCCAFDRRRLGTPWTRCLPFNSWRPQVGAPHLGLILLTRCVPSSLWPPFPQRRLAVSLHHRHSITTRANELRADQYRNHGLRPVVPAPL